MEQQLFDMFILGVALKHEQSAQERAQRRAKR
jgi:hypothetical protein